MTPQHGYAVCHSVPKSDTIPIPALPILETLQIYLYLCSMLGGATACCDKWSAVPGIQEIKGLGGKRYITPKWSQGEKVIWWGELDSRPDILYFYPLPLKS